MFLPKSGSTTKEPAWLVGRGGLERAVVREGLTPAALEELAELDECQLAPCHGHVLERAAVWAARALAEWCDV